MKKIYLIVLLTFFGSNAINAQNLKPDLAASKTVNVPPKISDHIGLTKIFVNSAFYEGRDYSGLVINNINTAVYTVEGSRETSDFYITTRVTRQVKKSPTASSSTSTSTDKQGKTTTTTTYTYDGEELLSVELILYLSNGTQLKIGNASEKMFINGSSKSSYQAAMTDYNNNRSTKINSTSESIIASAYSIVANEYLFTSRTVSFYSIAVKSRKMDYSDINTAAEKMQAWLKTSPTDLSGADVVEANKIYDLALMEFEPENKKARVDNEIAAVCFYAKACMEYSVGNYRKAEEHILKSEELDRRIHFSQEAMKNALALLKERKVFN